MNIKKVNIENFKSYRGKFSIELNSGINILVGDNEAGKSTILEAIHLALTGILNGKYLKNELTQYLFNNDVIQEYVISLKGEYPLKLPSIIIELFLDGEEFVIFEGDKNSQKKSNRGFSLEIAFDEKYKSEYEQLINIGNIMILTGHLLQGKALQHEVFHLNLH